MIVKVDMFTVVCDHCKIDFGANSEYCCWNDENYAEENAMEANWIKEDGKHFCSDCYHYGDDDEIVLNENRKDKYKTKN